MENFIYERLLKPLFFLADPEDVHNILIKTMNFIPSISFFRKIISALAGDFKNEKIINGIKFKNPIGLAAGFDKNAEVYSILSELGFGFIEIGTVTLKPQEGNPRPRVFRIPERQALLNKMGFPNQGAYAVAENLQKKGTIKIPLGINIGKNSDTPLEKADKDYAQCFKILKNYGDYFVVNISCPNIKDLCQLHEISYLKKIIESILKIEEKPLFLKISPDIPDENLVSIVKICLDYKIGIIATNTTINRFDLPEKWQNKSGGLSGKPLKNLALEKLKKIREISRDIPLISCGGIFSKADFIERLNYGADLVQIYTAMIYRGPFVLKDFFNV